MRTKIKILFFSDTHIGFDHPIKRAGKRRRRGYDFFNNFQYIIDQAIFLKVDFLVHCGDVFDKPNVHEALVTNTYLEFVKAADQGIRVIIVPGNHERSVLPTSIFLNHRNIHVFFKPQNFSFSIAKLKINIAGFPFIKHDIRIKFPKILSTLNEQVSSSDINFLCIHHAIDGAKVGVQEFTFFDRPDTLNIHDLPGKYDFIIAGHIHKHQELTTYDTSKQKVPVIYTGATERTMFDQIDETCGYYLFEIRSKTNINRSFHPIKTRQMKQFKLEDRQFDVEQLKSHLLKQMKGLDEDAIVQINSLEKSTLFTLSRLVSDDFFPAKMSIDITGFSRILYDKPM